MHDTPTLPGMDDGPTRDHEFGDMVYTVSAAHPEADRYPWMPDDELQELADDIAANGQDEPIRKLPDGRIVDGRNRELACLIAEVLPEYATVDLAESEIPAFVRRKNALRRHLSRELRRELIADALRENPDQSNRAIAAELNVSDHTVNSVRSELESTSQIAQLGQTKGRDGKTRPAKSKRVKPAKTANVSPGNVQHAQTPVTEPPPHPFQELMDAATKFAGDATRAMGAGTVEAVRLRDYLSWCGLVLHEPGDACTRAVFIQLRGVKRIIELAGNSGKAMSESQVRREWMEASGGVKPHPAILLARAEKARQKAENARRKARNGTR